MSLPYRRGLQELANGVFAYLQPNGSWGLSNAGLVVSQGESLLVDTLFDLPRTRAMLDEMVRATDAARRIGVVVNTHANGDHYFGNSAVAGARIIASETARAEMEELSPKRVRKLVTLSRLLSRLSPHSEGLARFGRRHGLAKLANLVEAAPLVARTLGIFDFPDDATLPGETFRDRLEIPVGDLRVELVEVGPAHTRGDAMVVVPDRRIVFTGDVMFVGGHPIVWAGPVSSWIAACDRILSLDVDIVVPGHGPITDKDGVREVQRYLVHIDQEARRCHASGLGVEAATNEIARGCFVNWGDRERVAINVDTVYREITGQVRPPDVIEAFARMARLSDRLALECGAPA